MRYCIFSDVHSNLEALDAVISASRIEGIDKYLCAGDLVGYAANPNECVAGVRSLGAISVAGNHDWASLGLFPVEYFNLQAAKSIMWTKCRLDDLSKEILRSLPLSYEDEYLTLVHASLDAPHLFNYILDADSSRNSFKLLRTKICFIGHTHVPLVFSMNENGRIDCSGDTEVKIDDGKRYIINVGSVGQPRDGIPCASFCIYDTGLRQVSIKRIAFDYKLTRQKILDVGLPRSLGDRLLSGR